MDGMTKSLHSGAILNLIETHEQEPEILEFTIDAYLQALILQGCPLLDIISVFQDSIYETQSQESKTFLQGKIEELKESLELVKEIIG